MGDNVLIKMFKNNVVILNVEKNEKVLKKV